MWLLRFLALAAVAAYDQPIRLSVKIDYSSLDGPGQHLLGGQFHGDMISRQTFDTQFVMDISRAVNVTRQRLFVTDVNSGQLHYTWEARNVIVVLQVLPPLVASDRPSVDALRDLTQQAQVPGSALLTGLVTNALDPKWGVYAPQLDCSLKLSYAIEIVGEGAVSADGLLLNQGGKRTCREADAVDDGLAAGVVTDDEIAAAAAYCQFEAFFRDDVAAAVAVDAARVDVLFVKVSALDNVLVHFRFAPETAAPTSVAAAKAALVANVQDLDSALYAGNVTLRTDATWGLSGVNRTALETVPYLPYSYLNTSDTAYERCKATHRCPRATETYHQHTGKTDVYELAYAEGLKTNVSLFSSFEDWRAGTRGWSRGGAAPPSRAAGAAAAGAGLVRGAHFNPFSLTSLGPSWPAAADRFNNGLVLEADSLKADLASQRRRIERLAERVAWTHREAEVAVLDAAQRARVDVKKVMDARKDVLAFDRDVEKAKFGLLNASQCERFDGCWLHFDTSALRLTGAINATGVVRPTAAGTEVAVFAFDSIELGPEVTVTVSGQRALALTSRSSLVFNTRLVVAPSELGGFPGGFSAARRLNETLVVPRDVQLRFADANGTAIAAPSNNVNGPRSGSVRVYQHTLRTSSDDVDEIQTVLVGADADQTLEGGFLLHLNGRSTQEIRHDAPASEVKARIEDALNAGFPSALPGLARAGVVAGAGLVNVTRGPLASSGGRSWAVTFRTAVGDVAQMEVTNMLRGLNTFASVTTDVEAVELGGTFSLTCLGATTAKLPHDASADAVKAALEALPRVEAAAVVRTAPDAAPCRDGRCPNGAKHGSGFVWTVTTTTTFGNVSPESPTSPLAKEEGAFLNLTANSYLTGQGAEAAVRNGHRHSSVAQMAAFPRPTPFSFAFGGGGAGNGGAGGAGFGANAAGAAAHDPAVSDLQGGSGGAIGYAQPFMANIFADPTGRGGAGGGAVELVAVNDLVFGPSGLVDVSAGDALGGHQGGGGGGSGGTVVLAAGGTLEFGGTVKAAGGGGGGASTDPALGGGGGGGGRVALFGQSILQAAAAVVDVAGGRCGAATGNATCGRHGGDGTVHVSPVTNVAVSVDRRPGEGAHETDGALLLEVGETVRSAPTVLRDDPLGFNGPEFAFARTTPDRVSFSVKLGETDDSEAAFKEGSWSATFALLDDGAGVANPHDNTTGAVVLGLDFGASMRHGTDLHSAAGGAVPQEAHLARCVDDLETEKWYQVDVYLDWASKTYQVRVDHSTVVARAAFAAEGVSKVGLYGRFAHKVWFDEIFVGTDNTMDFECPRTTPTGAERHRPPAETWWPGTEIGPESSNHAMTRHESHLLRRALYSNSDGGGIVVEDGDGHRDFISDVKQRQDLRRLPPGLRMGSLLLDTNVGREDRTTRPRYYWFGEHERSEGLGHFKGGVGGCSSEDLVNWRNEGTMLHYANLTDMVLGVEGPFVVQRPQVLYNAHTGRYVMWFNLHVDGPDRDVGMAGVAVSDRATGPFQFVRSFYPDGNSTFDQAVYKNPTTGEAYLGRTYYAEVEYVLPAPQMQPMWESVKDAAGDTNFGLSYHRTMYDRDYDDWHDTYIQRYRNEDKEWKVVCVDRVTGTNRTIARCDDPGYHTNEDGTQGEPICPANSDNPEGLCKDPEEYKIIIGQGSPVIESRFMDPTDPKNNEWRPESVPGVQAQDWGMNYKDGSCGNRKLDDDLDRLDPDIDSRERPDRSNCSNIADNPVHPMVKDQLVGVNTRVVTRRAKYVAISKLTADYLGTTGVLSAFEGELENNQDLLSLLEHFGMAPGEDRSTTFHKPVESGGVFGMAGDWDTRFHQYENEYGDRSYHSTACVFDGSCPVDFAHQIPDASDLIGVQESEVYAALLEQTAGGFR